MSLELSHYAHVTELMMQFPVGETYKFDVWLHGEDGERQQLFSVIECPRRGTSATVSRARNWFRSSKYFIASRGRTRLVQI